MKNDLNLISQEIAASLKTIIYKLTELFQNNLITVDKRSMNCFSELKFLKFGIIFAQN